MIKNGKNFFVTKTLREIRKKCSGRIQLFVFNIIFLNGHGARKKSIQPIRLKLCYNIPHTNSSRFYQNHLFSIIISYSVKTIFNKKNHDF